MLSNLEKKWGFKFAPKRWSTDVVNTYTTFVRRNFCHKNMLMFNDIGFVWVAAKIIFFCDIYVTEGSDFIEGF